MCPSYVVRDTSLIRANNQIIIMNREKSDGSCLAYCSKSCTVFVLECISLFLSLMVSKLIISRETSRVASISKRLLQNPFPTGIIGLFWRKIIAYIFFK